MASYKSRLLILGGVFVLSLQLAASILGQISVRGSGSVSNAGGVIDPGITIASSGAAWASVNATITTGVTGDILTVSLLSGYTSSWNSGQKNLTISASSPSAGNQGDFQTMLRTLQLYPTFSASQNTKRTIKFTVCEKGQVQLFLNGIPHIYRYVPGSIIFNSAITNAGAATNYGQKGYLATLTSAEEVSITTPLIGANTWIGGSDWETEGTWKWVTGPENGTTFYSSGATSQGQYSNFASGQPDNANNEDYLHILTGAYLGYWNDVSGAVLAYLVEFGGMAADDVPSINVFVPNANAIRNAAGY